MKKRGSFKQISDVEQDRVFQFLHKSLVPKVLLRWSSLALQRVTAPGSSTMQITSADDFMTQIRIVMEQLKFAADASAEIVDNLTQSIGRGSVALRARRSGKNATSPFDQEQMLLTKRANKVNTMFFLNYLLQQWQVAAYNELFFNLVVREIFAERDGTLDWSTSGYSRDYSCEQLLLLSSVGERVAYKVKHAQIGRLFIWTAELYKEMQPNIEQRQINFSTMYAPIYAHMAKFKPDSVAMLLEYFMRVMFASTAKSIEILHEAVGSPAEGDRVERYYNNAMALVQQQQYSQQQQQQQQQQDGKIQTVSYQRNCAELLGPAPFENIIDAILARKSALGDETTMRESLTCVWVSWLQNAQRLVEIVARNPPQPQDKPDAILSILMSLPMPHLLAQLFATLEIFIQRQHASLLQQFGFDLDQHHAVTRMRRHLNDLQAAHYYCDSVLLHRTSTAQK